MCLLKDSTLLECRRKIYQTRIQALVGRPGTRGHQTWPGTGIFEGLPVGDVGNGTLIVQVDVEPVLFKVHGDGLAGPNDAVLLREVFLAEELRR